MSRDPETILLCALRFWSGAGQGKPSTTPTLRAGVRKVARAQGISPGQLDRAERQLVKGGLAAKPRKGVLALTDKGRTVSNSHCKRIELPPWDWKATYKSPPGQLDGYSVTFKHPKLKGPQSLCIEAPSKEAATEWAEGMARGAKVTRVSKRGSCGRRRG